MKSFYPFLRVSALSFVAGAAMCSLAACGTGSIAADPAASSPATSHFKADLATGYGTLAAIEVGAKVALQGGYLSGSQVDGFIAQRAAFKKTLDDLRAAGDSLGNETALANVLAAISAAKSIIQASQGIPQS